jgi:hypothetical protein
MDIVGGNCFVLFEGITTRQRRITSTIFIFQGKAHVYAPNHADAVSLTTHLVDSVDIGTVVRRGCACIASRQDTAAFRQSLSNEAIWGMLTTNADDPWGIPSLTLMKQICWYCEDGCI